MKQKYYISSFKLGFKNVLRNIFIKPINSLRKPREIIYVCGISGDGSELIKNSIPVCPRCNELVYDNKKCVFCGQKFKGE